VRRTLGRPLVSILN